MIKKIHHLGIAVRDLEETAAIYSGVLGLNIERTLDLPSYDVKMAFVPVGD